jgi:cell fate regulator YaaT (PSP1 superfamily)
MIDVVVVTCKDTNNIYYLSPNSLELKKGDEVLFDTDFGIFSGIVCKEMYSENKKNLILPLKNVLRLIGETDKKTINKNSIMANKALEDAKKYSKSLGLDMNFVDSYVNFDASQLFLSFMSDSRVDFRDLVKKMAQKYKMRIELRQIGVRDKAKKIGGLGPCGLFLCCNSFLTDFDSVSINMAKNQMLALNPSKINGICGRLLCCLGYENDSYSELKKTLPKVGLMMDTPDGMGKVVDIDVFGNTYSVDLGDKGIVKFPGEKKNGKN